MAQLSPAGRVEGIFMQPVIEVSNLRKRYGSTLAVDDISLAVQPGEICLLYTSPSPRD